MYRISIQYNYKLYICTDYTIFLSSKLINPIKEGGKFSVTILT